MVDTFAGEARKLETRSVRALNREKHETDLAFQQFISDILRRCELKFHVAAFYSDLAMVSSRSLRTELPGFSRGDQVIRVATSA